MVMGHQPRKKAGTSLPAFDCPKETIRWARRAICNLELAIQEFFSSTPRGPILRAPVFCEFIETDPCSGHHVHKLKLFTQLPGDLSHFAGDALFNTRHAFD